MAEDDAARLAPTNDSETLKFAAHEGLGNQHADYQRQAAEHFGSTPTAPVPSAGAPQQRVGPDATTRLPRGGAGDTRSVVAADVQTSKLPSAPQQWGVPQADPRRLGPPHQGMSVAPDPRFAATPAPPASPVAWSIRPGDTGPVQMPPVGTAAYPRPPAGPPTPEPPRRGTDFRGFAPSGASTPPAVVLAGTALVVAFAVLVFWWLFLPGFFLVLYILVGGGALIGYLVYRSQNLQTAQRLESKAASDIMSVVAQLAVLWRSVSERSQSAGGAAPPVQPGVAPYAAAPGSRPGQQQPGLTGQNTEFSSAVLSALLVVPSLIAYVMVYNTRSFSSVYQPWAILMALTGFFVVCVVARSIASRRFAAGLLAVFAAAVFAFLTSPSPDFGLSAMVQSAISKASSVSGATDMILWSSRAPVLAMLLFVVAWGLARRRNPVWILGLLPAAGFAAWSIWYSENPSSYGGGWFGQWLSTIGVFVAGCIACWFVDAISGPPKPRNPVWAPFPPTAPGDRS